MRQGDWVGSGHSVGSLGSKVFVLGHSGKGSRWEDKLNKGEAV